MALWKRMKTGRAIGLAALIGFVSAGSVSAQFGFTFPVGKEGYYMRFSGTIHDDRDPDTSATIGVPLTNKEGKVYGYSEINIQNQRRDEGQEIKQKQENQDKENNSSTVIVVNREDNSTLGSSSSTEQRDGPGIYVFTCNEFNDKNEDVYAEPGEITGLKNEFYVNEPVEIDIQCINRRGYSIDFKFCKNGEQPYTNNTVIKTGCELTKYKYESNALSKGDYLYELVVKDGDGKIVQAGNGKVVIKDKPEKK